MGWHGAGCGQGGRGERGMFGGGRSWSFGPGNFRFEFDPGQGWDLGRGFPGGGGRGGAGRRGRFFGSGELRLVLLKLIADEPRHGYDLIKAIEELTHGVYAPSPGVIYPTLTMLQDMGQIEEQDGGGSRKKFAVTEEGRKEIEANAEDIERLMNRLEETGSSRREHQRPEIGRAMGNLMHALKNRVAREGWNEELLAEVTDILDDAAKRIERLR
ncbi:PadR family transcriptional regulator [Sphingomonas sp. KRR8]|uniref:PadR family transcriptional regulator n=1 Tax=Sphingomonas sp. KRR8 TaxID=2942996 RepID=UPI0020211F07|nr:PadR family transcriptional regulator [Sphingomonas sp. KRR8]URD60848.1 PadR family transcriptional regulator [Sphingomonas sp. KRR8]